MNVLYDISILGWGHAVPVSRTGIYRVVKSLTPLLASSSDCKFTFCSPTVSGMSPRYLASHPELSHVPFSSKPFQCTVNLNLHRLNCRIGQGPRLKQLPLKVVHRAFSYANTAIERNPIDTSTLAAAQIYHSPFDAFPEQTANRPKLQRFLTVYDLIPLLFPHYATPAFNQYFNKILTRLHKDDWVLAISEATKQDLCANHPIDPSRVFVTPLAADPALFYPAGKEEQLRVRRKYNLSDRRYLLSLGTLEPRKNIDRLIRCFARLVQQEHLPDLNLVLTGSKGFDVNAILNEAATQAVKDRILLAGRVEDEDLAGLYSGAELFAYPSLYEGFGLPPLEAMQCGTPVITSNTSSLPEVVGDAGLMATPTDEDALCQSLLCLLEDAALRAEKAKKALERARQFSWERCANLTIQAYQTALIY